MKSGNLIASNFVIETCRTISLSHSSDESYIGECVTFQCTLENGAAVQWGLNGTDISNDPHYNINTTSGTLTIQEVRSTDSGNYTCGSEIISLIVKSK